MAPDPIKNSVPVSTPELATFRRQVRLQVYLPLGLGILAVVGVGLGLWLAGVGQASVWADIGLVYLIVIGMVLLLVFLAVVIALTLGVSWLILRLPEPAQRLQEIVARIAGLVRRVADRGTQPFIGARAGWNSLRALPGLRRGRARTD
jgi:cell division protein FtsW (lipid II flippase)